MLVIFGLIFMLYALAQFTLESKRKLGPCNHGSRSNPQNPLARRD